MAGIRDRQINKYNKLLQKQEGNITISGSTRPNHQPGRSTVSAQPPHSGWRCSPSTVHPANTDPDNCHNSQLGDVADNAGDQGLRPRNTTVPSSNACNLATTAPNNCHNSRPGDVAGNTRDQGLRPGSTSKAPWLQPQLGPPYPQSGPSGGTPPTMGQTTKMIPAISGSKTYLAPPNSSSEVLTSQRIQ